MTVNAQYCWTLHKNTRSDAGTGVFVDQALRQAHGSRATIHAHHL